MLRRSGLEGPVNLGNPDEHTVLDLAEQVLRVTGGRSTLVNRPLPPDDPQRRCPDITLARQTVAFTPTVSLDDGLRRTIENVRRELGISLPPVAVMVGNEHSKKGSRDRAAQC